MDDHPAVEVQHHCGCLAQHPPRRLLDGEAPALPADDVAVEDHTNRLETEDLFQVEALGQRPVKILRLPRLALELRVELGKISLQGSGWPTPGSRLRPAAAL